MYSFESFCLSDSVLISPLFFEGQFCQIEKSQLLVFLQCFEYGTLLPLSCKIADEVSMGNLTGDG